MTMNSIQGYHCARDENLHQLLTRFWTQEEVKPVTPESLSPDDANCEFFYVRTHFRDDSGRYVVRLPLKMPATELGDSMKTAERSLSRLLNRIRADSNYQNRYYEFLSEYESLGHMSLVPDSELRLSTIFHITVY